MLAITQRRCSLRANCVSQLSLATIRRDDLQLKASRARWASPIFSEILLAALLIMCNAAEKFCALVANFSERRKIFGGKQVF
jgi:hypothetical protein